MLASFTLDAQTIAFAILGGGFGVRAGEKIRNFSPSAATAPAWCCFLGALFGGAFASILLTAAIAVGVVVGIAFFLRHTLDFWKTVLNQIDLRLSVLWIKHNQPRTLSNKAAAVHQDHQNRVRSIQKMDISPRDQDNLLVEQNRRYQEALTALYGSNP